MKSDYTNYSLSKLEEWLHDAMLCTDATPQDIVNVIKKVIEENCNYFKNNYDRCLELLNLLNSCNSHSCENEDNKEDKVIKWILPVNVDGLSGDCYINLPDDLLEAAGLVEGDQVEWIDLGDGSYQMRKL